MESSTNGATPDIARDEPARQCQRALVSRHGNHAFEPNETGSDTSVISTSMKLAAGSTSWPGT